VETSIAPFDFRSYQVGIPPYHSDIRERALLDHALSLSAADTASSPTGNHPTTPHSRIAPSLTSSNYLAGRPEVAGTHHETGLLCHYRYNVAPWIDIDDPESSFGIKIMLGARESRPLFAAILALATYHRSLTFSQQSPNDLESALRYRREAENGLEIAEDYLRRAGSILLFLADFFSSGPQQWRSLLFHHLGTSGALSSLTGLREHLEEPLFWLYFRIGELVPNRSYCQLSTQILTLIRGDLATAITGAQPPLLPFLSYLHDDGSPRNSHRSLSQSKTPKQAFQHLLFLLASCLSLIFGTHEASFPHPERPDGATFASMRNPALSSGWTSLWTDCQRWYNDRPVELQQIVEIRGVEVDQIDTQDASSFPILIYTTRLALVSNAVYHIASLLLLTQRPRLLKTVAGPRCFMSHIWHAQSIAGIATSNDFPEQWDPILVTGLILIAKDMTHGSQQSAILERLRRITATTGIKLDQEIDVLKSGWSIAGHNEGTIT
jgi:hypothetical protein